MRHSRAGALRKRLAGSLAPPNKKKHAGERFLITGLVGNRTGTGRGALQADECRLVLLARNTEALETLAKELRQVHKMNPRFNRRSFPARNSGAGLQGIAGQGGVRVDVLVKRRIRREWHVRRAVAGASTRNDFKSTSPPHEPDGLFLRA